MSCLGTDPGMSHFQEFRSRLKGEMKYAVYNIFYKGIYKVLSNSGLLATSMPGPRPFKSSGCVILSFGL